MSQVGNEFTVDVVIPVRSREEYDVIERLNWRATYRLPNNICFVVVDYGSPAEKSQEIKALCHANGFRYIFVNARDEIWNLSKARNAAILASNADYILFEDVDLISHCDFYKWLNLQVGSLMRKCGWPFIVVPVSYLTEQATGNLQSGALDDEAYADLTSEIYNPNSEIIDFHAPTSSYLLCRRKDAISVGGNDPAFEGWGFEDSDFALKLLRKTQLLKPRDFYRLDTRNYRDQVQWRGWRALYRVFGDLLSNKGIYSFHVWHPIAEHRSPEIRDRNHKIFKHNSKLYSNEKFVPAPLWNPEKATHLFLSQNPHSFNTALFEKFDNPMLIDEVHIEPRNLDELISKHNIESVIFNNPYANDKRRAIYNRCRELGVRTYVVERGALPWSIYIDEYGFCAESTSYSEVNWPTELSESERQAVLEYIANLKMTGAALEPQADLIGGRNLKRTLFRESAGIKVLFIALQSPSDTTTNFFCGKVKTYENFISEVRLLPHLLGPEWRVVYKNHPLSLQKVAIDGATCVDAYHIGDILEMADAVTLINSGVGVLAVAYHKPVYFFGQTFYSVDGLNAEVISASDLAEKLKQPLEVDKEKSIRFISYLLNDFYSFATWRRNERPHTDKAKMSISEDIRYQVLRVSGQEWRFSNIKPPVDLQNSILFDRYRLDDFIFRKENGASKPVATKPAIVPSSTPAPSSRQNKSTAARKWRKFLRTPRQFFIDAVAKRIAQ